MVAIRRILERDLTPSSLPSDVEIDTSVSGSPVFQVFSSTCWSDNPCPANHWHTSLGDAPRLRVQFSKNIGLAGPPQSLSPWQHRMICSTRSRFLQSNRTVISP